MRHATIVVTIVTSILAVLSPSLAASDADLSHLGEKMSGAFRCSTYAGMFQDWKEQKRLFQIGLKAARDFVEGVKSSNQFGETKKFLGEVSTYFMVGMMYETESTKADNEIRKYQDGLPREKWLPPDEAKTQAALAYRKSDCSLIQ